jgi:hypothetical protein
MESVIGCFDDVREDCAFRGWSHVWRMEFVIDDGREDCAFHVWRMELVIGDDGREDCAFRGWGRGIRLGMSIIYLWVLMG